MDENYHRTQQCSFDNFKRKIAVFSFLGGIKSKISDTGQIIVLIFLLLFAIQITHTSPAVTRLHGNALNLSMKYLINNDWLYRALSQVTVRTIPDSKQMKCFV